MHVRLCVLLVAACGVAAVAEAQSSSAWSVRGGGSWVAANRIVRQTEQSLVDPKKYVVAGFETSGSQSILAQVRVDSFPHAESRAGLSLFTNSAGNGFNFVMLAGNRVGFLADGFIFGNTCAYTWQQGRWYWMRLSINGSSLTGTIWLDSQAESQATTCTQTGWTQFSSGAPGLNGGGFGETVSFDNVRIGDFADDFNAGGPPVPVRPTGGIQTGGQFVANVHAVATTQAFDVGAFRNLMQRTAWSLICTNNPSICTNYTPGAFIVVPSPFYGGGTWMRDSAWTLAGLNDAGRLATLVSTFATRSNTNTGQVPTLLPTGEAPWFGAGGQGNPLPDDDSNFMFVIAARLGWRPLTDQAFLNQAYTWMQQHATSDGRYQSTSHAWMDSYYPTGVSGPASVTVSANMQGLYAVALRALKDLGVAVPQAQIDAANARYAALTSNGGLRAHEGTDRVDVSSLIGDALSLFIWNQPILGDAVVQQTLASFAEVYDTSSRFVGYKVISEANGSFLDPSMFSVERPNTVGGDYQNGGSWLLYDALALYAGARHAIPSMRAAYIDRFVRRLAAELRAGVRDGAPLGKSHEFLCTAANAGTSCGPIGSTVAERVDYGWNAFILRLLSDELGSELAVCAPVQAGQTSSSCSTITASPTVLRFAATKAGSAGALLAATPGQAITVQLPGGTGAWTATVNQPWLTVSGASGSGSGRVTIGVANPANVIAAATSLTGVLTITPVDTTVAAVTIPVVLVIDQSGTTTVAPFGQVDTPTQDAGGVQGAIGVTGWVLDNVGVTGVQIFRNCLTFENQENCQEVLGQKVVYIGNAAFLAGARPDVEAAFGTHPQNSRAGWGYLMLTPMLPNVGNQLAYGGQGALTLYAFATDVEGNRTLLGRSSDPASPQFTSATRITMDNTNIAKPFGAIDTPGQGETVGGMLNNFGWVLTPDANDRVDGPADILVPTNGSTMTVFLDGAPAAQVAYNQCRGDVGNPVPAGVFCNDDVSNIFGNATPQPVLTNRTANATRFRNLDAARGAIGVYTVNTTTLANGMHTIAWSVTDSAGRTEGIGSRFFTVLNTGTGREQQ